MRHPELLRHGDAALLLIDMQEPFLRTIWQRDRLMHWVSVLLRSANLLDLPVVVTEQNRQKLGGTVDELAALLPTGVVPADKLCFSCAGSSRAVSDLDSAGKHQLILCGVETHICVTQTALDLLTQSYQVHVVADAVSSRSELNWDLGLRRMERAGAILTSTESVLYELLDQAGTPEFRDVLGLIK
jgi:isochorismate hydrolase